MTTLTAGTVYKKNFISEALLRIDFQTPIDLTSDVIKKYKTDLGIADVELKERSVQQVQMKFEKDNKHVDWINVGTSGQYIFNEGKSFFELDPQHFLLLTNRYEHFPGFIEIFRLGYVKFQALVAVKEFKRIGLRFLNKIKIKEGMELNEWQKYINHDFIPNYSSTNSPLDKFSLRRNRNLFVYGDGEYLINIHTGIWNNNYPGIISDQEFILDIDCYVDNIILSDNDILKKPHEMSDLTFKYFELIASDDLKALMREG